MSTTIAALATPPGAGAVALLRISGPNAKQVAGSVFAGRSPERWEPRSQHFGRVLDETGGTIDEVLLTFFPGPASFTGEDVVEIAMHGGVVVSNRVLEAVLAHGAVPAEPGEFSKRAFFNGRIDLTQAEAIMDLISAQTELAARAATEQLSGRLGEAIETIRQDLIALLAHLEAFIDFPDEDIDPDSTEALLERAGTVAGAIDRLLSTADQGRILREGLRTVICGAPNAGKSSLLNLLLGFDRAIVNEKAGTTRDTIEEVVNLKGIPLRLIDTAGIREASEEIEREGVDRSRRQLETADLILLVIDSHEGAAAIEEIEIPETARFLRILNKADLPTHANWIQAEGLHVSCRDEAATEQIRSFLYDQITKQGIDPANLTSINRRHQRFLSDALESIERGRKLIANASSPEFAALEIRSSLDFVGEIVGKTDVEEILGEIFSTFCIGK